MLLPFALKGGAIVLVFCSVFLGFAYWRRYEWYRADFVLCFASVLFAIGVYGWNLLILFHKKYSALEVSEEGIRNLDPFRPNVIPWEDIVEIRPRELFRRLEIYSSSPFQPIRLEYEVEGFEVIASYIARLVRSSAKDAQRSFKALGSSYKARWGLFFLLVGALLMASFQRILQDGVLFIWIPLAAIPGNKLGIKRDTDFLEVADNHLTVSSSGTFMEHSYWIIRDVCLTIRSTDRGFKYLDVVMIRSIGDDVFLVLPGVNPLDVFYSVHAAWEEYKKTHSREPIEGAGD